MLEENTVKEPFEPEAPPDLGILWRSFLVQLRTLEDHKNLSAASVYRRAMRDWNLNLPRFNYDEGRMMAAFGKNRPVPSLAVHWTGLPNFTVIYTEGPEAVSTVITLAARPAPPPEGVIEFGPRINFWHTEAYWTGESTVPAGHETTMDGKQFVMVVLGQLGSMFYSQIWELVD